MRAAEKGLYLNLHWKSLVPATIETDEFRLRQLLVNLLGNAVKFTRKGGVTVNACLLADGPKPRLQLSRRSVLLCQGSRPASTRRPSARPRSTRSPPR